MAIKITLTVIVFGLLVFLSDSFELTTAQKKNEFDMIKDFKVESNKPSIFLTFEKVADALSKKVVLFKLHNNSNFPIAIDANFDTNILKPEPLKLSDGTIVETIPNNSIVEVCFDVVLISTKTNIEIKSKNSEKKVSNRIQQKKENPAKDDLTTCFWRNEWRADEFGNGERIWIKSNQSIIFRVPRSYLRDDLKVSTLFNYEWEFTKGKLDFDEPKHKVYFYGSDIPNR